MKELGTVTLETKRLILRKAKISDAKDMFNNWANDEKVTKYMTWQSYKDVDEVRGYIEILNENYKNNDYYEWFIEHKEIGEVIGSIGVVKSIPEIQCVNIGYCLGFNWWHKGIMTEAFSKVIEFFMEQVEVNRIEATHDTENVNSGKVMQKCGLKYEGTLRQANNNNTNPLCDMAYYSILKKEYIKQK